MNFNLKIITPEGVFFNKAINFLLIRTANGNFGVYANHSKVVALIEISWLKIIDSNKKERLIAVNGGIFRFYNNQATILSEFVSFQEDVNLKEVERMINLYKQELETAKTKQEIIKVQTSLKKAINLAHGARDKKDI
ncbi:ATP synthase F1 subunit epsilon [Mycoplasma sp. SG1]|uniref:ATP synthase F1 subunit epsilon n=1 Tax=Mycoplasma sp. SG1 TaxID=2810348 RepID=UPI002023F0EA|nr:ATP synthase F1 subunit epsilon [Mycoplasma sp. SG1]URM52975.1 ATP synthase F1 subunit epsilon [Mycoplasma sp. SG1]